MKASSDTYPNVVPVFTKHRHGLPLVAPSSTAEPLWQAAEIHGVNVYDLVQKIRNSTKRSLICPHS